MFRLTRHEAIFFPKYKTIGIGSNNTKSKCWIQKYQDE